MRYLALVLSVGLLTLPFCVNAETKLTGTIEGRISNSANGSYLSKAKVVVEGTGLSAYTNDFGEYTLRDVPAGSAQLRAIFTGQAPEILTVNVAAGKITTQDVVFGGASVRLNPFVVESERFKTAQQLAIRKSVPRLTSRMSSQPMRLAIFRKVTSANLLNFCPA